MKEGETALFSQNFSKHFSGPKQFVKLNPVDLKSPTLKYDCFQVLKKHDNFKVG